METKLGARTVRVEPIVGRLRSAAARTTRLNAEVTLLCEAAIAGADRIERLREALKVARDAVYNDAFPIGWNIDRLDDVLTPNAAISRPHVTPNPQPDTPPEACGSAALAS